MPSQDFFYYPIHDFGPLMKGMVIGGMGVLHVFLAQFAIGGGWLMCYLQWRAWRRHDLLARCFLASYFRVLVLVSFVLGAVSGVGMWLTAVQVSPRTIGEMVDEFHWIWAVEWTFFCVEVVAGYAYYRCHERLSDRARLQLLVVYSCAAWASLFWINGILSWMLTPGSWVRSGSVWQGFFNASFWPSLVYRTLVSWTLGGLAAIAVVHTISPLELDQRRRLVRTCGLVLAPMVAMPIIGLWYLGAIPEDSRGWVLGGSPAMTMALAGAVFASTLLGLYVALGLLWRRLYVNFATAILLLALALGATGAGELVREGVRKPYTIRQTLYANSLTPADVLRMRRRGAVADDPYPVRGSFPHPRLAAGAKIFRLLCSVCHTIDGANGVVHLTATWHDDQLRMNLAKLQHTKSFMPPFAGTAEDLEALVQFLLWRRARQPRNWAVASDDRRLARIRGWLREAGTEPGGRH